jgi:hypothetical protein
MRSWSVCSLIIRPCLTHAQVDHNNVRDLHKRFVDAYASKDETLMTSIANTIVHEAALHSDGEVRSPVQP